MHLVSLSHDLARTALLAGALVALTSRGEARAQQCHDLPNVDSALAPGEPAPEHAASSTAPALAIAAGVRLEAATAAIERRPIDYQGLTLKLELTRGSLQLRAQAPMYRLRNSIRETWGAGDAIVTASWTAIARPWGVAGVSLPIGLPTGDVDEHLGMGHVMVMPAVFAALRASDELTLLAGVYYGRGLPELGGGGEHHHVGMGPYVSPMSAEELGASLRASQRVAPPMRLLVEAAAAQPFDDDARLSLGAGLAYQIDGVGITAMIQAGALQAPFTARGVIDLSYPF
jgi:hypothetical protein